MKFSIPLAAVSLTLLLAGCASGPKLSEAPQLAIPDGMARIVVYRTSILGGAIQPTVNVNGTPTAKCQPGGVFTVDVNPGEAALAVQTEKNRVSYVSVSRGDTAYVRCDPEIGLIVWQVKLTNVPQAQGQAETQKLSVMGAY